MELTYDPETSYIGESYATGVAPETVLSLKQVAKILKDHHMGTEAMVNLMEDVGVVIGEPYGEGEVITWQVLFEWLGY